MNAILAPLGTVLFFAAVAAVGPGLWYQVSAIRRRHSDPLRSGRGSVREKLDDAASRWLAGSLAALGAGTLALAAHRHALAMGAEVALAAGALAIAVWPWPSLRRDRPKR